jgi:hypothetical protein
MGLVSFCLSRSVFNEGSQLHLVQIALCVSYETSLMQKAPPSRRVCAFFRVYVQYTVIVTDKKGVAKRMQSAP